ncbi:MAG: preprotein translocase subunit SecY [Verrucomicrobiales bacterium]
MVSAFTNSLKIPELRERIFFTLAMIVIVRIGAAITLPGVDAHVLQEWLSNEATRVDQSEGAAQLAAMLSVFSGGALQNCAVFALGIMPYISASIMLQLLTAVVPRLSKLAREDGGRQKINQYTRLVTIVLCLFQGGMLAKSLQGANPNNPFLNNIGKTIDRLGGRLLVPDGSVLFVISTIFVITAGTLLLMWLGEQITERGIGNGISLIICINIVGDLPGALVQVWKTFINPENPDDGLSPIKLVILIAFLIIVIAAIIALTQAQRRVPVHYAKRVIGRKMMGGQTTFLPMKVNYAGVMPIIFASAILLFPSQVLQMMGFDWAKRVADWMSPQNWYYYAIEGL